MDVHGSVISLLCNHTQKTEGGSCCYPLDQSVSRRNKDNHQVKNACPWLLRFDVILALLGNLFGGQTDLLCLIFICSDLIITFFLSRECWKKKSHWCYMSCGSLSFTVCTPHTYNADVGIKILCCHQAWRSLPVAKNMWWATYRCIFIVRANFRHHWRACLNFFFSFFVFKYSFNTFCKVS
jgi:hypothetical protein